MCQTNFERIVVLDEPDNGYPIMKRKHKYYKCECGNELKVTSTLQTDWYGTLEYMRCPNCNERGERMVAQDNRFLGLAAR